MCGIPLNAHYVNMILRIRDRGKVKTVARKKRIDSRLIVECGGQEQDIVPVFKFSFNLVKFGHLLNTGSTSGKPVVKYDDFIFKITGFKTDLVKTGQSIEGKHFPFPFINQGGIVSG